MKLYCLVNNYLSGIRAGAQAVHGATNLMTRYYDDSAHGTFCVDMLTDWRYNYETVAILNGGDHDGLRWIYNELDGTLPCDYFIEPGLNNAISCVSFVASTIMVEDMARYRTKELSIEDMQSRYGNLSAVLMKIATMRSAD